MSNMFEALEHARRERESRQVREEQAPPESKPALVERMPGRKPAPDRPLPEGINVAAFSRTIDILLPEQDHKVIMFVGFQGGEGVSTIVQKVARSAAVKMDRKVLVLDAAQQDAGRQFFRKGDSLRAQVPPVAGAGYFERHCYRTENEGLCVAPLFGSSAVGPTSWDLKSTGSMLAECRKKFDLVLIDAAPLMAHPDGILFVRHVDGVVLVLEAERTTLKTAEYVKEKILNNGGNILGVVFNKRRFHIPDFIYKRFC